jgi:hypothetical protein
VLTMAEPKRRRRFLLGWSLWRRAHQAVGARCRAARHALGGEGPPKTATIAPEEACLTDEQWTLVLPLLPSQKGRVGKPPNDHRVVLGDIMWVACTGSPWRAMREEFGKWETAYRRHELWVKQGLRPRLLRALGEADLPGPATKRSN